MQPELDGKDWYCFECHRSGDVASCSNCFRVFHPNCISGARRKFESQKLINNYPIPATSHNTSTTNANTSATTDTHRSQNAIATKDKGQSVTIIYDDSDDVVIESSSQSNVADVHVNRDKDGPVDDEFVDKRLIRYNDSLCSVCNINRIDYSCGLDKAELNYMLKFVLYRIRAWVRIYF